MPDTPTTGLRMDPLEIAKQEWPVIAGAPWLAAGLLLIGAALSWWLRGHLAKAEIAGLRAKIDARDAQLSTEASRLALARDQLEAQAKELDRVRSGVLKLEDQQRSVATLDEIAVTTASILKNVERAATANTELTRTVSTIDFLRPRDSYNVKLEPIL